MFSVQFAVSSCALIFLLQFFGHGNGQYFVDPDVKLVDFWEGWGTSLAWWPDVLGGMPEDVIRKVTEDVFSDRGLHLNIVRYTIGGTTPGNYPCGSYRAGGATESYRDGPDLPYNWTRDSRQRRILEISKELGVDTFEAFSNSPPQWMTISGCAKGNPSGGILHPNFNSSRALEFATYIADVLEHFKNEWKIEFQTFAPFNEPYGLQGIGVWDGETSAQEGCNMDRQTMTDVIRQFHDTFTRRNISTELSVSDETHVDTAVNVQNYFREQNVTQMAGKISVHGYWDSQSVRRDILYSNAVKDGHRLWMDEMGWGGTPVTDMGQGLDIANRIVKDVRDLLPSAWVYWQVMEDIGLWGLIEVPYNNATVSNIAYNSGFYSFLQFTKYIRRGSTIIYVNDPDTIATHDPLSQNLVLVTVNPSKEEVKRISFDLQLFSSLGSNVTAIRTSPQEQVKDVSIEVLYSPTFKVVSFEAPPESITTVVVPMAILTNQVSLIDDGDFETNNNSSSAWSFYGNAGISGNFTWLGQNSGYILNGTISQSILAESTGKIYLSARCASNGAKNASLSIYANGIVTSVPVTLKQFTSYGIVADVNEGELVTIRFSGDGEAYIDNIYMHSSVATGY